MAARLTLFSMMALAVLIVLGMARIQASPRALSPTELAPTMGPAPATDRDGHAVAEKRAGDTGTSESGWSSIGRRAILAAASESVRMEPIALFVVGSLLLGVATFARLRVMRRVEGETELRLSRNTHR